jgi:hypothetical protein
MDVATGNDTVPHPSMYPTLCTIHIIAVHIVIIIVGIEI